MTAEEAVKISNINDQRRLKEELESFLKDIKKCAENGYYYYNGASERSRALKVELMKLGYKVEVDYANIYVSWGPEEQEEELA
jgi:hypothetical protein